MSLLKGGTPETEQAFMRALRRLISGNPRHDQNVKLAKCGRLRVTVATVAREAGRSRTLIGSDGCRYPKVREAVLAAMDGRNESEKSRPSAADLVNSLREDKAVLENHVKVLATRLHDAFLHTQEMKKRCKRLEEDLAVAQDRILRENANSGTRV